MRVPGAFSGAARAKRAAVAVVGGLLLALPACRIPALRTADAGPVFPAAFNVPANPGVTVPGPTAPLAAAVGGALFADPAKQTAPVPPVANAESSARLGAGEFFNDPILLELIGQALAGNQELKVLEQDIQIAGNEVLARRGLLLPFLTLGLDASVDKSSRYTTQGTVERRLQYRAGKGFPDPLPNFLAAANFSWQVDIWRKLRNARDAAALRYLGTAEGRNYVVTRLVADIAENYYGLLALDKKLETLDITIALQEQSLTLAEARKEAARDTALPVQRFQAEVAKNRSEKLIVRQEIVEVENRINFLVGRFPQPVERRAADFIDLTLTPLGVGVPAQLLLNRPDIRQAERELQASGLDVLVARAEFLPSLDITGRIGYEAFNPKYLFNPGAFVAGAAGGLVGPLVNRTAIQAAYGTANAKQLQAVYNYQRVILNAFAEVVNRVSMVDNYGKSIELKRKQLAALEASVETATNLFQNARKEYVEVLLAQRDLLDARTVLIETKRQQLSAVVNAYQALGGGDPSAAANRPR